MGTYLMGIATCLFLPALGWASHDELVACWDCDEGSGTVLHDVCIVQAVCYHEKGLAGMATECFALAPRAEYTLEWAVYLNRTGDYFEFSNAVLSVPLHLDGLAEIEIQRKE